MSKKFLSPIKLAQGATNPTTGSSGELFFNTVDLKVYAHNGTTWLPSGGGVTVSATAPSSPVAGDCWYDSVDGTLYVYYNDGDSNQWVEVAANSGISVALSGRLGVVETYVTTLQSQMTTAQGDITSLKSRATSLETRASALELADATTNRSGLVPLITSVDSIVAGSTGTASFSSTTGTVTITNMDFIRFNNIFTVSSDTYIMQYELYTNTNSRPTFRLRIAGTDDTASNYAGRNITVTQGSSSAGGSTANITYPQPASGAGIFHACTATFHRLYDNTAYGFVELIGQSSGGDVRYGGFSHTNPALVDGLSIFSEAGGTLSGTISFYKYRK